MTRYAKLGTTLFALTPLILSACAVSRIGTGRSTLPTQEFRGHYAAADGSWFTPCNGATNDKWWVTTTGPAVAQMDSAKRDGRLTDSSPVFVRWLAVQTTDGKVGPRGPGQPALLVREVQLLRAAQAEDCR